MEKQLQHAVAILAGGGVVAYPTDTVYGLGADALNEEAVNRIYRIKQRPFDQPLPLLISDISEMTDLVDGISEAGNALAHHFFPGGLTLVFRKSSSVPAWVSVGGDTVALRIPNHPITLALIRGLGKPLIGTSANLSGSPSSTSAEEVREQLGDSIDFIIDGGICPGGIDSTIVDVTGESPEIVREGAVSWAEVKNILKSLRR